MIVDIKRFYEDGEYIAEYEPTESEMQECLTTLLKQWYRNYTPQKALEEISNEFGIEYEQTTPKTFADVVDILDLTQNYDFLDDIREEIEEYFNNKY